MRRERGARDEAEGAVKKDENESSSFIQATKEVPTMKNLDNNLHRRATESLRGNRPFREKRSLGVETETRPSVSRGPSTPYS